MNGLFSPRETSEIPGIAGALSGDRASGPSIPDIFSGQVNPVAEPPQPGFAGVDYASTLGAPNADPAAASLRGWLASKQQQEGQQAPPFKELTMKSDGTFAMKGDQSMLAEVMGQLTDLKQMKAAAMARVAQLQQQESSGSPILDALSQFAGGMAANDPKMPGWVRALGMTNLQMGPQGIRQRRMQEEQNVLKISDAVKDVTGQAMQFEAYQQARSDKEKGRAIDERRLTLAEETQANIERDRVADNFRDDLKPVFDVIGKTGLYNSDHEAGIRAAGERHRMSPVAIESEIAKAKANAAAARSEIDRRSAQKKAEIGMRAATYASQLAAGEQKAIRGQVVRANISQASKMADGARMDEKEALRLQGLNEMALAADRMQADLAADDMWQGVLAGQVAETTKLTTAMQTMLSNSADLFVKKMASLGVSFAKTSDAEMKKILATVPTATMTVAQAKRLLQIIHEEGERAAAFIAQRNWAESGESIAGALPAKYRAAGVAAHARKQESLTPQQRLAYGLSTGDEALVQQEVERAFAGSPGAPPREPNSTDPTKIRMANPKGRVSWEAFK